MEIPIPRQPMLQLYKQSPPERATILGKGPSLDRWIVDPDQPGGSTLFACNEVPYAGLPEWCYWVTGEKAFKLMPTPPRCVPIRRWPGQDDGGYLWSPDGFITDIEQRSVGAVAICVVAEWMKYQKTTCELTMVGFDAIRWKETQDSSKLGYAKCIPPERLIGHKPDAPKPITTWKYGRANKYVLASLAKHAERFSKVEWYDRITQES